MLEQQTYMKSRLRAKRIFRFWLTFELLIFEMTTYLYNRLSLLTAASCFRVWGTKTHQLLLEATPNMRILRTSTAHMSHMNTCVKRAAYSSCCEYLVDSNLTATSLPAALRPRNTSPMPPEAACSMIRYAPTLRPTQRCASEDIGSDFGALGLGPVGT